MISLALMSSSKWNTVLIYMSDKENEDFNFQFIKVTLNRLYAEFLLNAKYYSSYKKDTEI